MDLTNNVIGNTQQSQSIRDSYDNSLIPNRLSTWLTGKAHSTKSADTMLTWWTYTFGIISTYIAAVGTLIYADTLVYQVIASLMVLALSRRMTAVILHQAVHNRLSGVEIVDRLIGEVCSILSMSQGYKSYQEDHCGSHHSPETFATAQDPIIMFMKKSGLDERQTKQDIVLGFLTCLLSPKFHLGFLAKRLRHNLSFSSPLRTSIVLAVLVGTGALFYLQGSALGAAMFVAALVVGYQISAFIEICSEHLWYGNSEEIRSTPYFYADISWGRFCGLPYPTKLSNVPMWYFLNVFYHLPIRLFILVGDLPQHDFHHRHPIVTHWLNAAELRNNALVVLRDNEPEYIDIWGLHTALNHVFDQLSTQSNYRYASEY
jgi:fatty acid desaturase